MTPTPECVSAVTGQVRHPETQLPQRGQSQEAKALWVVKRPAEPRCSRWTTRQKPRNWHHTGTRVDPIDSGELPPPSPLPFPTTASTLRATSTLQKFPVLCICQAQRPLNVVFDKSNWQDKQSKTSSLSDSRTPFKKENVLYASSRRSGSTQTPPSNLGERLGKGLTPPLDRHICKSN